jgi:hypothetical protein
MNPPSLKPTRKTALNIGLFQLERLRNIDHEGAQRNTKEDTEDTQRSTRERVKRLKAARWEPQKMPQYGIDALRAYKATDYTDFHRFKRDLGIKISVIRVICGFFLPAGKEDKSIGTTKDTQESM